MPDSTAYDPHSVDDMGRDPERWHERTVWASIGERIDGATREQLMALMQGGIGQPETGQ